MSMRLGSAALAELSDDELVARFQGGDNDSLDVLLQRYRRFARAKARGYFLVGADSDDIEQEGMIGLYKAARDFRPDRQASLPGLRRAVHHPPDHHRHQDGDPPEAPAAQPATCRSRASGGGDEPGERHRRGAARRPPRADPADEVVSERAHGRHAADRWPRCSPGLEVDVLRLYVEGKSYQEIGEHLGRHVKSIDNALQRIKRKLDVHLAERAAAEDVA